jgi:anti-sigma B factor antagonist
MTRRDVEISRQANIVVARLDGEVDLANAPLLSTQMMEAVGHDGLGLVVDLSRVRYIDSVGVQMLFSLLGTLQASRQAVAIALDEGSPIRKVIKVTRLDEAAVFRPSVEECVAALQAGGSALY